MDSRRDAGGIISSVGNTALLSGLVAVGILFAGATGRQREFQSVADTDVSRADITRGLFVNVGNFSVCPVKGRSLVQEYILGQFAAKQVGRRFFRDGKAISVSVRVFILPARAAEP